MSQPELSAIPEEIYRGDSVVWSQAFEDFPADEGWTATAYFVPISGTPVSVVGVADGSAFDFELTSAVTAEMAAGEFSWFIRVEKDDAKVTVCDGQTTVKPNPATESGTDFRSHVKKMLDAIEAAMEGSASSDVLEYTIKDRSLKKMSKSELRKEWERYKALYIQEVNEQRLKKGLGIETDVVVRFGSPE